MKALHKTLCLSLCVLLAFMAANASVKPEYPALPLVAKENGVWVYGADYLEIYRPTLDAMFMGNWEVVAKEEVYEEPEELCIHGDASPHRFTQWVIAYTDGAGQPQQFLLDNESELDVQIEHHVEAYAAQYYKEKFCDVYLAQLPRDDTGYVYAFFGNMNVFEDTKENEKRREEVQRYRERLCTPEGALRLAEITPANVFEKCPLDLSFLISLEDKAGLNEEKAQAQKAEKQVTTMLEAMQAYTENTLNANLLLCIRGESGEVEAGRWVFTRGEICMAQQHTRCAHGELLHDSYNGVFW